MGVRSAQEWTVALAGNPNVGKSTVFNALTGLRQHTGNWPGKTVVTAQGQCRHQGQEFLLIDLPGTYSLMAHSAEEEAARDYFCFGGADGAVVVCDATCLERNLNLVLQVLELQPRTVVCVNLLDEAKRKGIQIDLAALSHHLGVPVVGTCAGRGAGLCELMDRVKEVLEQPQPPCPLTIRYGPALEFAAATLTPLLERRLAGRLSARWTALRRLEGDGLLLNALSAALDWDPRGDTEVMTAVEQARETLKQIGLDAAKVNELVVQALVRGAHAAAQGSIAVTLQAKQDRGQRLDRLLTHRFVGIPMMILMLAGVLWITIEGANYPSALLSEGLFWIQDQLTRLFVYLDAPDWLHGVLVEGVYRVLAWVVSVMLPPMAIFFPLFTLLEDFGYLPRVAFLLDHAFQKARACGKQALTMCMGFGCNAVGVVGCRIIDSPRERLIAMLTNSFVPCNGRFPTLIAVITMFFVGSQEGLWAGLAAALFLTGIIMLGVLATFLASRVLSATVLKGVPSSFTLELPPYRWPRVGQVALRSILDRALFVLGRAAAVAAPAGLVIWLCANVSVGDTTILNHITGFLDPFGRFLGMDGVILTAFLLGFPANEIVIPIALMAYLATGTLQEAEGLEALHGLLVENGWSWLTAVCTLLFSLFHWPCSTTCLSMGRESGSLKWTLLAIALPTVVGASLCAGVAAVARLLGWA